MYPSKLNQAVLHQGEVIFLILGNGYFMPLVYVLTIVALVVAYVVFIHINN